jgi:hypothetical protein
MAADGDRPLAADLPEFRAYVREKKAALAGFMELGASLELVGDVLRVLPRSDIYLRYFNDNKGVIGALATEYYGRPIKLVIAPPDWEQEDIGEVNPHDVANDHKVIPPRLNLESVCATCGHALRVCWSQTSTCWSTSCRPQPPGQVGNGTNR